MVSLETAHGPDGPIGVFDSGMGGLTVVRALTRSLPHESIVYFGDTARVPYGAKSPTTVRRYSREIAQFLVANGAKVIVVACNTATAHALDSLRSEFRIPIVGVIDPGARAAVTRACHGGAEVDSKGSRDPPTIGVLGTTGTIRSGAYERAIKALCPDAVVISQACPLFVPLVEEGWTDEPATRLIARSYLHPLVGAHVERVVLGCTHYPLLRRVLADELGVHVRLVDSAEETAREVAAVLERAGLQRSPSAAVSYRFVCSDDPLQFLELGRRFLGSAIDVVEHRSVG